MALDLERISSLDDFDGSQFRLTLKLFLGRVAGSSIVQTMNYLLAEITWRLAVGDPNWVAWLITFTHLISGLLCITAGRRQRILSTVSEKSKLQWFWFVIATLMFALCLNKQLDLQTLLTQSVREIAKSGGWYAERRRYQAGFILACGLAGVTAIGAFTYVARGRWREIGITYLGIVFLVTFVVIRAASFHHVDRFLYHLPQIGNLMNAGLEFAGAFFVGLGAWMATRRLPISG